LACIVYGFGFMVDIMDVDSAQYASISREMAETDGYLQVKHRGEDYLDKPPLLFWVTSVFFKLFGYHNWSFKIGAFLFTALGAYSTFRLGKVLYSSAVGKMAALMLLTCQAMFLINNDLRTDTILTGAVVFSIWQLVEWLKDHRWKWLFGAALGLALAMMAKGPIGLMVPVLAYGSYLIGTGRIKDIFRWEYLVVLAVTGVLLSPMLYGLYQQYDMHPEKTVRFVSSDGTQFQTGVSGLEFYFWTQSFGRITGENVWKDSSGPFFFVHNFIWSFLPWSLLFILAFFSRIGEVMRGTIKGQKLPELLTPLGFLLPFIALSLSNYKLPHYIFILYPLSSILLAGWWYEKVISNEKHTSWQYNLGLFLQLLVLIISFMVIYFIFFYFFPGAKAVEIIIPLIGVAVSVYIMFKPGRKAVNLIIASALVSISANYTMNSWFYPELMEYQSGSNLAKYTLENDIDPNNVFYYHYFVFSYGYYVQETLEAVDDELIEERLEAGQKTYVITEKRELADLQRDFELKLLKRVDSHPVTLLKLDFLMAETRPATLKPVYLVEILRNK